MTAPAAIDPSGQGAARHTGRAFAAIVLANVCLSFGPWLVRIAGVAPEVSAFWRMALAAPLLLLLVPLARQPMPALTRPFLLSVAVAGLFFAADLAAWHVGIVHTRMANAALFGNAASFLFPIWGFFVARAWPSRRQGAALLLALAGVILLAGRSYELSPRNLFGDAMCLFATLTYTVYLVAIERARSASAALPLIALVTLATMPPLLVLALATGRPMLPQTWTPLVLLAIGSQCLGQGLIAYSMGRLPGIVVGLALMIQPIVGATIGWLLYGETLSALDFAGAMMIAGALVIVRMRS